MRYDYLCNPCEEVFEVSRRLADETPVRCPVCESADCKKLILSTAMIHVYWKKTLGLGHKGSIILPSAKNGLYKRPVKNTRREADENELQLQQGGA